MAGAYSRFKSAKASGGSYNYLKEGDHRLQVMSAKMDKDRKKVEFFATQARVIETSSDDKNMQPGRVVDWMTKSDKDAYEGNVKQFFMACFDLTEEEIDAMDDDQFEELMELLVGEAQGCAGRVVDANVKEVTTRDGNLFNAVRWSPGPEELQPGYGVEPEPEAEG